ncbi:MAG: hypothetical protein U0835_23765 [Isosphaeraceae bacterium]
MPQGRSKVRPSLERLETRWVLSSASPTGPGTFVTVPGVVKNPGVVAPVTVPLAANRFQARHTTIFGLTARPGDGTNLRPAVVAARGLAGQHVGLLTGAGYQPGINYGARAYLKAGTPGPVGVGVAGRAGTTGPFLLGADLPGDVNGDGQVTLADLQQFAQTPFPAGRGSANYNPALDFNRNGQVGQDDVRLLLRNLAPLSPASKPLQLQLKIAPEDAARGDVPAHTGAVTHQRTVTIVGHATPGSAVFFDSGLGDYTFSGKLLVPDAQGDFRITVTNREGLNNYNFLAVDNFGRQRIQDLPIVWLDYGAYEDLHPRKT